MRLLGYNDRWSGAPGDEIQFKVSSEDAHFEVDIVRLFQVDDRASAPDYREQVLTTDCAGRYPGLKKPLRTGSFLHVPNHKLLETRCLCLTVWLYPTWLGHARQGIFGKRSARSGAGFELLLSENGRLRLELARNHWESVVLECAQPLEKAWYFITAQYDSSTEQAMIWYKRKSARTPHLASADVAHTVSATSPTIVASGNDLLIGALHSDDPTWVTACLNGKLASPAIYHRILSAEEIIRLYENQEICDRKLSARWDFAAYPFGIAIPDRSGNDLAARVINNPMRAVTGAHWDGSTTNFRLNPEHYDAIHFHDDDLEDAGWSTDLTWKIPEETPSGVYAARLRTKTDEDYVPFVVRPRRATAPTIVILPTFTYQAYANERYHAQPSIDWTRASDLPLKLSRQDQFSKQTRQLGCSLYDRHTDGSFACYSSLRRPVVNFRPKMTSYWNGAGRHFVADMYLVDWLDRAGFAHDMATDHDLHAEGLSLLSQYRVVMLGSHPEYFSWPMRRALETHVGQGGRLMYLGGNGGWWVTGVDPARPHVIEARKAFLNAAIPGLGVEPGEEYLSTSGQRGGSWREIGRAPESLFGVGFAAQGFCHARGYRRQPDSFDQRVKFIFDGIDAEEIIGDFGLAFGGAAGDEFDRAHVGYGTPPGTYVLASSFDHPQGYCVNISATGYDPPEQQTASLRSDVTYYEVPSGGAVFSAGSMCWCTSLPHNDYNNNVSRVTANVLRHFICGGPAPSLGTQSRTPTSALHVEP